MDKLLIKLWVDHLRYIWSNWYYRKAFSTAACIHYFETLEELQQIAAWLYECGFVYETDGILEMFDAMDKPPSCYFMATKHKLVDDCDGFHAAILHILKGNGIDARLLTIVTDPLQHSHTVAAFKWHDGYRFLDYDRISPAFNTKTGMLAAIKEFSYCSSGSEIKYTCFSKWDGRWEGDNSWLPEGR